MKLAPLLSIVLCSLACKSGDPAATSGGGPPDAAAPADEAGVDSSSGVTDAGSSEVTPGVDVGVPPAFIEPPGKSSDPFLDSGAAGGGGAASTGISLGPSDSVAIAGTIASGGSTPAWADSDAYAFKVTTETTVQAELVFAPTGSVWSVAIHRADRKLVAWWGMATEGRALTVPKKLPPGDYFVHVAAAPPAPASSAPYTVRLRSGDLGGCASGTTIAYTETEATAATNDTVAIDWYAYPRLSATAATDAPEPSGVTLAAGASAVIAGSSRAATPAGDSYLDRDAYVFTTGADTHEVRVLLEYTAADVNLDVFVFAADSGKLVGTGVEVAGSPEQAAIAVEPGKTYWLWIGARDERAIGGDKALPASYRATLCGRGGAK